MDGNQAPPDPSGGGTGKPSRIAAVDLLRDRILEHLKRGPDSISGLSRELSKDRSAPIHRLTVAGYLQALAEAGILRELDRPPSKLYQLQNPEAHWSLHQRVQRLLAVEPRSEPERLRLALAALQTILNRPIFHGELVHAGFTVPPDALEKVVVPDGVRRTYRDMLQRRAQPRIDIAPRDPLYLIPATDPILTSAPVQEILRRALIAATGSEHLVAEKAGPQQAQLDFGAA